MKFGKNQKLKFDTDTGSYSLVTDRENFDSQLTATDYEAQLLVDYFGDSNILVGPKKDDPQKAAKDFKHYPSGKTITLNLVRPKPEKTELRLYLSSRAGFKPEPNSIWFMFVKDSNLWIGSMPETEWRNENSIIIYDESEEVYQDSLAELDEIKIKNLKAKDVFSRDRNLAIKRIKMENYACEYNSSHNIFISRHTNLPFLEAHHLIPMSLQKLTAQKLDVLDNIFSLCPYCHRAIHHADKNLTRNIIDKLVDKRPQVLDIMNVTPADLFGLYSVEEIY
ncbi:MAG: HNH endonuclease [Methylobacter sp.]|nr:HNH endonuclease [Candidatus Methylobacter titanis]